MRTCSRAAYREVPAVGPAPERGRQEDLLPGRLERAGSRTCSREGPAGGPAHWAASERGGRRTCSRAAAETPAGSVIRTGDSL
ncbi:hypothetical protein KUCAC02_003182 [Chaenocephalus aceratus]|uniref:Uncharacterized protein n=1 Tax=Chaenocephalus aceratus TaxID=36190 RepID=A0ACB9WK11_CHAAC|nr:hypothetical protein KUCAC02_003182 [Chaenocephalus aceratus]